MRRNYLATGFILLLMASAGTAAWVARHSAGQAAAADRTGAAPKQMLRAVSTRRDASKLDATMAGILNNYPNLDVGVAIADLNTGATYQYGDQYAFEAASVDKLLTATLLLHCVEQGNASLNDDIGDTTAGIALQNLIVASDNTAWVNLNDYLTHNSLSSYAQSIGMTSFDVDANTITPSDVTLLLAKLYGDQLLNGVHTRLLLSYMRQANETGYIVAAVPAGATVYHKVGLLDNRLNEAAIVVKSGRAYAITIFSKTYSGAYDFDTGQTLFRAIAQAADDTFLTQ